MCIRDSGYIDGELEEARAAQVREHAASCDRCARSVEDRQALREAVRGAGLNRPAPAGLREAVLKEVRKAQQASGSRTRAPRWAWAALAACFILCGAVLW